MQFTDAVVVAGTHRREDGYMVADARIARTGIQTYLGSEVGRTDMATVRVYRPGSEVFSQDTLKSAAHRPVTNDHPPELVTSENWTKYARGQTGDEITGEGIFIKVPLMIADEATIRDVETGKQELSSGYTCDLDWTAGKTPAGEAYDAVQRNIRINHVAIVDAGRAGPKVRIGDGANSWGANPVLNPPVKDEKMNLKTVHVDGIPVEVTEQGYTVIDTLNKRLADATSASTKMLNDHAAALAVKDADIAKKDAQIADLQTKVLDQAAIDKLVVARADLLNTARTVAKDVKLDGLTDAQVRRAVVVAKLGDAAVKDKSDAYIDARYEILVDDAKKASPDAFRDTIQNGGGARPTGNNTATQDAYHKMLADNSAAWNNPGNTNGKAA